MIEAWMCEDGIRIRNQGRKFSKLDIARFHIRAEENFKNPTPKETVILDNSDRTIRLTDYTGGVPRTFKVISVDQFSHTETFEEQERPKVWGWKVTETRSGTGNIAVERNLLLGGKSPRTVNIRIAGKPRAPKCDTKIEIDVDQRWEEIVRDPVCSILRPGVAGCVIEISSKEGE